MAPEVQPKRLVPSPTDELRRENLKIFAGKTRMSARDSVSSGAARYLIASAVECRKLEVMWSRMCGSPHKWVQGVVLNALRTLDGITFFAVGCWCRHRKCESVRACLWELGIAFVLAD